MRALLVAVFALAGCSAPAHDARFPSPPRDAPYLVVLGVAQDAGAPQAGTPEHPGFHDPSARRLAACLGLVDPRDGRRWLFEATPDLPVQLHRLDHLAAPRGAPDLAGVFLTHAHIGHYTGLMHFGHEVMGARDVPVFVMPRFAAFLRANGPWDQLVRYGNIALRELAANVPVELAADLRVTPLRVPHREEYSEVVAFRIDGPSRSALFLPDIDKWARLDAQGARIEDWIAAVDVAFLDATFFSPDERPGRDLSAIPHPFIVESLERFAALPASERAKIRFVHLNWSNPALDATSSARATIERAGMRVAEELELVRL